MKRICVFVNLLILLSFILMDSGWAEFVYGPETVTGTLDGQTVECSGVLTTSGTTTLGSGASATLSSVSQVVLKPGFYAARGSTFNAEIECGCPVKIFQGDYEIYNQEDLDGLIQYTKIDGNLNVTTQELVDLDGLECLTEITDFLRIRGRTPRSKMPPRPSTIKSLYGLRNLKTIGGFVHIDRSEYLSSTDELNKLETIGGDLVVSGGIRGLNKLTSVGGDVNFYSTMYQDSSDINIFGFNDLESIGGSLRLYDGNLKTITGFKAIKTIGGDFLTTEMLNLSIINAFNNLEYINGNFEINATKLENLSAFSNLKQCTGQLEIRNNPYLVSLNLDSMCAVGANSNGGQSIVHYNEMLCPIIYHGFQKQILSCSGNVVLGEFNNESCDNDQDGMMDHWELANDLSIENDDSSDDGDEDGFNNIIEYTLGTSANDSNDIPGKGAHYIYDSIGRIIKVYKVQ